MLRDRDSEKFLLALGMRLRKMREQKGWTLEQTEEHGWVSWRHLQKIETGKNVTILTLRRLAKLYRCSIANLLEDL